MKNILIQNNEKLTGFPFCLIKGLHLKFKSYDEVWNEIFKHCKIITWYWNEYWRHFGFHQYFFYFSFFSLVLLFFLSNLNIHIVPIWLGDEGDRYWSSQLTVNNSICMSTMYICHVFYVLGTVSRVSRVPWRVIPAVTLGFSLNLAKIIVNHHVKIITTRAHYLLLI